MSAPEREIKPVSHVYLDESGTHDNAAWLVIGMLFVRAHGPLHSELMRVKKDNHFINQRQDRRAEYAEFSLKDCRSPKAATVGCGFIDAFLNYDCYFRCLIFEWALWRGRYFGTAIEADALKKRKAYKKWCEMLLHHERDQLRNSDFYLDELRMVRQYDVLTELEDRFTRNYRGSAPWIRKWIMGKSWHDELQCLQLCDLLTGAVARSLTKCDGHAKSVVEYLGAKLEKHPAPKPIKLGPVGYWRGFDKSTLSKHFPKFSEWVWKPC